MFRLAIPSPVESPRCAAWVLGVLFGVAAMFGYADYVMYTTQRQPVPPAYVAASQPQRVAGPASNVPATAVAPETGSADRAASRRGVVRRHVRPRRRPVARGRRARHRSH